ncbi:hypothetical protein HYV84_01025 [Candidatus Woesearchaeota archaeon]|nr:hypothetical protein [Candidatus Woesearchaeota archaeon]
MFAEINPYVAKIVIAARGGDSIRKISKKIRESYGWTYKWVLALEAIGALKRNGQAIQINRNNSFYKEMKRLIVLSSATIALNDAYLLPNLAGLEYAFTSTDAVFIWAKGGYNIGRSRDSYPVFIEVVEKDKAAWVGYFSGLGISYSFKNEKKKGIYFVISRRTEIEKEYCDDIPVLPLAKTVEWAKKYRFNFQPALEMLDELYPPQMEATYSQP